MASERVFKTENIDLASYLSTMGHEPEITRPTESVRATFVFEASDDLRNAIVGYESGAALPAKRLLNRRSWLFREAGRVVRKGDAL